MDNAWSQRPSCCFELDKRGTTRSRWGLSLERKIFCCTISTAWRARERPPLSCGVVVGACLSWNVERGRSTAHSLVTSGPAYSNLYFRGHDFSKLDFEFDPVFICYKLKFEFECSGRSWSPSPGMIQWQKLQNSNSIVVCEVKVTFFFEFEAAQESQS